MDNRNRRLCWSFEFVDKFLTQVISVSGKPESEEVKRRFAGHFGAQQFRGNKRSFDETTQNLDKLLCWKYDDVSKFLKIW